MSRMPIVTSAVFALAAASAEVAGADSRAADRALHEDLKRVAQHRIFFGHQSVGDNILDGLKQLAATAAVDLRIASVPTAAGVPPATLGHAFVAQNRDPLGKLRAFERAFGAQPAGVDVALIKFCYLDFTAETDPRALFNSYRAMIDGLRKRNPRTSFVHVTAPLTEVQQGARAYLKRLLGRAPYGMLENLRREEYNALLRKEYAGREPLFDLARVESTAPDGKMQTSEWNGKVAPMLAAALTDDGGHLNSAGRLRAARELASVIAAIPRRSPMADLRPER